MTENHVRPDEIEIDPIAGDYAQMIDRRPAPSPSSGWRRDQKVDR